MFIIYIYIIYIFENLALYGMWEKYVIARRTTDGNTVLCEKDAFCAPDN